MSRKKSKTDLEGINNKPIIGVMPLWDDEKESLWMLPGYLNGIIAAGGIPFIFPLITDPDDISQLTLPCDGILFTGGHDVNPAVYHEKPLPDMISKNDLRDTLEGTVFDLAGSFGMPMLGICRGLQFFAAYLGGSLYQDLPTQSLSDVNHHQEPPYDQPAHEIRIVPGSPLHQCLGVDTIKVNSCHHQGIKTLPSWLVPMAYAPDGLIEAICERDAKFAWAVQWHPEFFPVNDPVSHKIFTAFVDACADFREYKRERGWEVMY